MRKWIFLLVACAANLSDAQDRVLLQSASLGLGFQSPRTFFKGLPVWAVVVITNTSDQAVEIPSWSVFNDHSPVTLIAHGSDGKEYTSTVNRFAFIKAELNTNLGPLPVFKEKWSLARGETRRCLVNLGIALDILNLPPGFFELRLRLWTNEERPAAETAPMTVQIVGFPPRELKELPWKENLSRRGFEDKTVAVVSGDIRSVPNIELRQTLAFALLLNRLIYANNLAEVSFGEYRRDLPSWLLPEATAFEFESALLRGASEEAKKLKTLIVRDYPHLAYRVTAAEAGDGVLAKFRNENNRSAPR